MSTALKQRWSEQWRYFKRKRKLTKHIRNTFLNKTFMCKFGRVLFRQRLEDILNVNVNLLKHNNTTNFWTKHLCANLGEFYFDSCWLWHAVIFITSWWPCTLILRLHTLLPMYAHLDCRLQKKYLTIKIIHIMDGNFRTNVFKGTYMPLGTVWLFQSV